MSDAEREAKDGKIRAASKTGAKDGKIRAAAKVGARDGASEARNDNAAAQNTAAILRMLGLAKRAGKLAVGTDATLDAVRRGKGALAFVASDASERTDRAHDKSSRASVPLAFVASDASERTDRAHDKSFRASVPLAFVASDASERTRKQIGDKCASYGVKLIELEADRATLAAALGFKDGQTSACAVTDRNMAIKIDSLIN